jgi:hypothetical protein
MNGKWFGSPLIERLRALVNVLAIHQPTTAYNTTNTNTTRQNTTMTDIKRNIIF